EGNGGGGLEVFVKSPGLFRSSDFVPAWRCHVRACPHRVDAWRVYGLDGKERHPDDGSCGDRCDDPRGIVLSNGACLRFGGQTETRAHLSVQGTRMEVGQVSVAGSRTRVTDFILLTKPNITFMVLITTVVGFYMGSRESVNFLLLINTVIGTALIAGGASALNQYVERHLDARMVRTRARPLPDGRLLPSEAL